MSEQLLHAADMTVTSYAGPARSDGGERRRVQIYAHDGSDNRLIDLSDEQWQALGEHFSASQDGPAEDRPRSRGARGNEAG